MIEFYYGFHTHQWSIHLLPSVNLYLESNLPYLHDHFFTEGMSGMFLTIIFLKWSFTIGLYRKVND